MGGDYAPGVKQGNEKIQISEEEKDVIKSALDNIEEILTSVEKNEENYAYADTSDLMDIIDSILNNNPTYEKTLSERRAASIQCTRGSEAEKMEGLKRVKAWVEKIKELL